MKNNIKIILIIIISLKLINCFKKKINDDYHDKAPCPSLVTQTSKGVFRWNSTTDQIIKQNCLYGGSVATHECKTASWINLMLVNVIMNRI